MCPGGNDPADGLSERWRRRMERQVAGAIVRFKREWVQGERHASALADQANGSSDAV